MYVWCTLTSFLTGCHSLCHKCYTNVTSCISPLPTVPRFPRSLMLVLPLLGARTRKKLQVQHCSQEAEAMGGHGRWKEKQHWQLTQLTQLTHSFYQQSQQSIFAVLWSCYKLPSAILNFKVHPECSETPASPQTKTKTTNLNVCNTTGEQHEPLLAVFHSMQLYMWCTFLECMWADFPVT